MLIDKYVNTISPYSIILRNNDRTTTYSTFSPTLYTERLGFWFFISLTLLFTLIYLLSAKIW